MAFFSTVETISYRKRYLIFFGADSDKSTLVEVFRRHENPILRNKLSAQYEESSLMSPTTFGYFLISVLAAALAMDQVIAAPRLLIPSMYFWTIESNFSKSKGRPVFKRLKISFLCFLTLLFRPFLELPYSTFFDAWELLLKIADGSGISMLGGIFSNGIPVLVGPFDVLYRL